MVNKTGDKMSEVPPIKKIEKSLLNKGMGLTIQQIMNHTKLARGTVKTYLDELIRIGRVHEEEYAQNTKVYFLNGKGRYQEKVQMKEEGILFIDVMTNPLKRPFVRIKHRKNKKDQGAILLDDEETIDQLIKKLKKVKPQLEEYRKIISKLETT